jgi:hypothetical protein
MIGKLDKSIRATIDLRNRKTRCHITPIRRGLAEADAAGSVTAVRAI